MKVLSVHTWVCSNENTKVAEQHTTSLDIPTTTEKCAGWHELLGFGQKCMYFEKIWETPQPLYMAAIVLFHTKFGSMIWSSSSVLLP